MIFFLAISALHAEQFDDISISAQSLHQGQTSHGYSEMRVLLENHSQKTAHRVTLVSPNRSWNSGNTISRLSRSITLAPNTRATVVLPQPPLPTQGDGALRLEIDGSEAGSISVPNGNQHMTRARYGGAPAQTTVFVSRSLDHSDVERTFRSGKGLFTAASATGMPDSRGSSGMNPTSWTPDMSNPGPHWLELDYGSPMAADRIRIYGTIASPAGGQAVLTGISGTNLVTVSFPSASSGTRRRGASSPLELTFATTPEPVKKVRLEFTGPSHSINIDAVEIATLSGSAWASDARASSDASAMSASYAPSTGGRETRFCLRAEFPVSEWSDQWLAYTAFDAIVVSGADFGSMPAGVANAVARYVECGGNLFILGGGELPESWRARGVIAPMGGGKRHHVGFGSCYVLEKTKPSDLAPDTVQAMLDSADELARYWQNLPEDEAANTAFKVVENLRIPIRGMVFIMLGFVLLIGPVNLIVLSRLKKRTWLLWTIPAISFVTCLLVFAYSLLREGITPDSRIESITLLDQVNHRATTLGAEAFYCPLTPNQGLRFTYETEVTPLVSTDYGSGSQREVDWSQFQHFSHGWVTARVPAHFFLRKSETRRERLQLEASGGEFTVVNGLGGSIRSLWLADAAGKVYAADGISAGAKGKLSAIPGVEKLAGTTAISDLLFKSGYATQVSSLTNNAINYLQPGTYIATLEDSPFLENALTSSKPARTKTACVVYGILDSPASAASGRKDGGGQ